MSDPSQSSDLGPDPVPAEAPTSQPARLQDHRPSSRQAVPASQPPPPPAGNRRGRRPHARVPARAAGPYRATDAPPPVQHYDACGRGSVAGEAPAGKPRGCFRPTIYDAGPAGAPTGGHPPDQRLTAGQVDTGRRPSGAPGQA
jgi:hypothetical protein